MNVVLLSTYDLGHQPFGLASPAAWLREAGASVTCNDLAVDDLDEQAVRDAGLIAVYLPMHTATRLAGAPGLGVVPDPHREPARRARAGHGAGEAAAGPRLATRGERTTHLRLRSL